MIVCLNIEDFHLFPTVSNKHSAGMIPESPLFQICQISLVTCLIIDGDFCSSVHASSYNYLLIVWIRDATGRTKDIVDRKNHI